MAELAVAVWQTCDYILQLENHYGYDPGPIPNGRPSTYGISVMCACEQEEGVLWIFGKVMFQQAMCPTERSGWVWGEHLVGNLS